MIGLMGLITGSGRVNLLSGRIRRYRVRFGSATWCAPANPVGRDTGQLGRVGHACAVRPAGPRRRFGRKADFK
jgi:hypothetical protein